jgi:hypothetical protein
VANDLGDLIPLSIQVKDINGTLADPTALTVTVTLPDMSTVSGTWPAGGGTIPPTHDGTGLFHVDYNAPQVGNYTVAWTATGVDQSAYDDTFSIDAWVSIVGLAETKAFLNLTTTTNDEKLRQFMLAATTAVEEYCNRPFVSRTVTRRYSGITFTDRIAVPVGMTSVTTVIENGVTLTGGTDYDLDPVVSVLYRRSGPYYTRYWLPGTLNISVTGSIGSTTIPADIRLAALLLIKHLWETQRGGMATTLGSGGETEWDPTSQQSIPRRVSELLQNYQMPVSA